MSDEGNEEECSVSMADFFESSPPNTEVDLTDAVVLKTMLGGRRRVINTPQIQLHCSDDKCNGTRFFRCITSPIQVNSDKEGNEFIKYRCSNCQKTVKTFSISLYNNMNKTGVGLKYGEFPPFGPPTPARLIKLIGPDRELFLKGRRCENQGLGVGALVYYRRVVEIQKNRILDQIIKVSEKIGASEDDIKELQGAKDEVQFSKALKQVKKAIPHSLLIDGHNPLLLLHGALSDGVHDRQDEECLELAGSVRVVLGELSDRIAQALKDEAELKHAVSRLLVEKGK